MAGTFADPRCRLRCRQSLIAASGSLGSRIGRASLLPTGWAPGGGVLVREDARIAHINNLACSVVKVPPLLQNLAFIE